MKVDDYFIQERRRWIRLHEKGGKRHDVPAIGRCTSLRLWISLRYTVIVFVKIAGTTSTSPSGLIRPGICKSSGADFRFRFNIQVINSPPVATSRMTVEGL
jgi:hypothetical protein